MNINPYAPPGSDGPVFPSPQGEATPGDFEVGDVLSRAFEIFKQHWVVLVFAPFLAGLISGIPNYLPTVLVVSRAVEEGSTEYWVVYSICMAVGMVVGQFFQVGQLRIFLAAARGRTPEFGTLFSGVDRFLPMLGTSLLVLLLMSLGFVLLIIPGFILVFGLSLATYYCVDQNLGPIEAARASWEATKGFKGKLFVYFLAAFGVALLGLLVCCIGIYPASSVIFVGQALIYIQLSGNATGAN